MQVNHQSLKRTQEYCQHTHLNHQSQPQSQQLQQEQHDPDINKKIHIITDNSIHKDKNSRNLSHNHSQDECRIAGSPNLWQQAVIMATGYEGLFSQFNHENKNKNEKINRNDRNNSENLNKDYDIQNGKDSSSPAPPVVSFLLSDAERHLTGMLRSYPYKLEFQLLSPSSSSSSKKRPIKTFKQQPSFLPSELSELDVLPLESSSKNESYNFGNQDNIEGEVDDTIIHDDLKCEIIHAELHGIVLHLRNVFQLWGLNKFKDIHHSIDHENNDNNNNNSNNHKFNFDDSVGAENGNTDFRVRKDPIYLAILASIIEYKILQLRLSSAFKHTAYNFSLLENIGTINNDNDIEIGPIEETDSKINVEEYKNRKHNYTNSNNSHDNENFNLYSTFKFDTTFDFNCLENHKRNKICVNIASIALMPDAKDLISDLEDRLSGKLMKGSYHCLSGDTLRKEIKYGNNKINERKIIHTDDENGNHKYDGNKEIIESKSDDKNLLEASMPIEVKTPDEKLSIAHTLTEILPLSTVPVLITGNVKSSEKDPMDQTNPMHNNEKTITNNNREKNDCLINTTVSKSSLLERLLNSTDIEKMIELLKLVSNRETLTNLDKIALNSNVNSIPTDHPIVIPINSDLNLNSNPSDTITRSTSLSTMASDNVLITPLDSKSLSESVTTNSIIDLLGQDKGASKYTDTLREILRQMPTSDDSKVQLKSLQQVLKLGYNIAQKERINKEKMSLKYEKDDDNYVDNLHSSASVSNSNSDDDDRNQHHDYDNNKSSNRDVQESEKISKSRMTRNHNKEENKNFHNLEDFYPDPHPDSNRPKSPHNAKENNQKNPNKNEIKSNNKIGHQISNKTSYRDDYQEPCYFNENHPVNSNSQFNTDTKNSRIDNSFHKKKMSPFPPDIRLNDALMRHSLPSPATHMSSPRASSSTPHSPRDSSNITFTDIRPRRANSPSLTNRKKDRGPFSHVRIIH